MNEGYARVDVDPQIKRNQENHTTDVTFNVVKKDKVHIGRIFITGNSKTRDYVIRREVFIAEGDLFSAKKIEQSLTRLKKLDFFEDVDISPADTDVKDVMNLQVKVKEKMTGSITLGGGFSSEDGMFISGQIQQKNLFGKGQVIALKGYLGQEAQRYMLSFTEPYFLGYPFSLGFDVYNWLRAYEDFTKDAIGFRLRSGFPFGQYSRVSMYYVFERGHVTDISEALAQAVAVSGSGTILEWENKSALGFGVERDTTDHPFLPTRGTYTGFNMELATRALGGDYDFFRHEYHAGMYYPLPIWKFIGHIRGEMGLMHSLVSDSNIPIYENFFLGGINSLRGWKFGQVGPKVNDVVVGGDRYAVANVELLFPIAEKMGIRGVLFFDTGNAWNAGDEIKLRSDVGAGVRWNSPFGPLRVEIGYNLSKEKDDDPYQWQFSAGAFF